jgi:serine/threonine protein kinase
VKPANILRTARGFVLGDLGIVHWGDLSRAFTSAGTITRTSVQLGSWYYMSPEQLDSPHEATPSSDVYALGITWIEMLTGEAPAPQRVAARRVAGPSGNSSLDALIARMTDYEPTARPDIGEIAAVIQGAIALAAAAAG